MRLMAQPESQGRYDRVVVLTIPAGVQPARELVQELNTIGAAAELVAVDVADPTDYGQLFFALGPIIQRERASTLTDRQRDVLLSAGTPQMQTLWVILVQAGILPGRMLQVIPAAFVPDPHPRAIREVTLDIDGFPEIRALRDEVVRLRAEARALAGNMIGDSAPMHKLASQIARVAPTEVPVLIYGETGTGKELLARAVHDASARASGPFIAENCGAFADSVLQSELFGHEPGAFTGAVGRRRGLFELASGGTLFLDEIAELSPQAQVTLLRVLQEGALRRVGGESLTRVDVRVIAATHRDLAALVASGAFRQDLYYRLRGVTLRVPPLRERIGDLEKLIDHFLAQAKRPLSLSRAAWQALRRYAWPGNIRELRAEVLRWTALCDRMVDIDDLADEIRCGDADDIQSESTEAGRAQHGHRGRDGQRMHDGASAAPPSRQEHAHGMTLAEAVADAEERAIRQVLAAFDHNLSQTARALAVDRNTLKRKMARYRIAKDPA